LPLKKITLYQVLQGIAYLHENNVVHRDIKLENILMTDNGQPIIADFDICKDSSSG